MLLESKPALIARYGFQCSFHSDTKLNIWSKTRHKDIHALSFESNKRTIAITSHFLFPSFGPSKIYASKPSMQRKKISIAEERDKHFQLTQVSRRTVRMLVCYFMICQLLGLVCCVSSHDANCYNTLDFGKFSLKFFSKLFLFLHINPTVLNLILFHFLKIWEIL